MVQWLGLHASTAGDLGLTPGQGTRILHAVWRDQINEQIINNGDKLGNKGKFLCIMKQNGFNVPDGIILDSDSYKEFVEENGIDAELKHLLGNISKENVSNISEKIQMLFNEKQLTDKIRKILINELDESKYYAVRSSGTKEDLEEHSFAGQYETYLNVKGLKNIEETVINCYKSAFKEVCLNYFFK